MSPRGPAASDVVRSNRPYEDIVSAAEHPVEIDADKLMQFVFRVDEVGAGSTPRWS
jgi:hypothetical protein